MITPSINLVASCKNFSLAAFPIDQKDHELFYRSLSRLSQLGTRVHKYEIQNSGTNQHPVARRVMAESAKISGAALSRFYFVAGQGTSDDLICRDRVTWKKQVAARVQTGLRLAIIADVDAINMAMEMYWNLFNAALDKVAQQSVDEATDIAVAPTTEAAAPSPKKPSPFPKIFGSITGLEKKVEALIEHQQFLENEIARLEAMCAQPPQAADYTLREFSPQKFDDLLTQVDVHTAFKDDGFELRAGERDGKAFIAIRTASRAFAVAA